MKVWRCFLGFCLLFSLNVYAGAGIDELESQVRPNPKVQDPKTTLMQPPLPSRTQPSPISETRSRRIIRGVSDVITGEWRNVTWILLPAVGSDPNEGTTIGVMPVFLITESPSRRI